MTQTCQCARCRRVRHGLLPDNAIAYTVRAVNEKGEVFKDVFPTRVNALSLVYNAMAATDIYRISVVAEYDDGSTFDLLTYDRKHGVYS